MLGGHSPPPRVAEHQMYMLPLGSLQVEGARCEDQDPLQEQEPHHPPPAGGRESRQMGSLQPLFWGGALETLLPSFPLASVVVVGTR